MAFQITSPNAAYDLVASVLVKRSFQRSPTSEIGMPFICASIEVKLNKLPSGTPIW
ncbi:hypothetical protein D3C81_910710 [compost metagenome]